MQGLKTKLVYHLFFGLLFTSQLLPAQSSLDSFKPNFNSFTTIDGYPQGIVTDLHQDKLGFIWVATADGLFRFDGYEFKEYRTDLKDKNTIPSNTVTQVITDEADNIWLSTDGDGLSKLDRNTGQFKHYHTNLQNHSTIPDNNIWSLCLGGDGNIWAGTRSNGLFSINAKTDSVQHFLPLIDDPNSLWDKRVTSLLSRSDGTLWVGTVQGINIIQTQTGKVERLVANNTLSDPDIQTIYETPEGQIWVGTENGLNKWDASNRVFERIGAGRTSPLSNQSVQAICIGPDQRLWVGTKKGLNAIDLKTGQIEVLRKKGSQESILAVDRVEELFLDQQNLLWIGTWSGPLNLADNNQQFFEYFGADTGDPNALSSGNIKSIFRTKDQILWIGTYYDGLNRIDQKTGLNSKFNTQNGLLSNSVYCLWADTEGTWIGTNRGLHYYEEATGRIYPYTSKNSALPNDLIWAIAKDQSGHLWIGTNDGLAVLKTYQVGEPLVLETFFHDPDNVNTLSMSSVRSLFVDHSNDLWIGTSKGGLNYYNRRNARFTRYNYQPDNLNGIPEDYIFFINEDQGNNIWVGTSKGASRLDRRTQEFTHLTEKDGLPNNYVFSIFEDQDYWLWMSTNRGLFKYNPENGDYKIFEKADGLQDNEFNQGAAFQDINTGTLFFAGINGVNTVQPGSLPLNDFAPPVVFTGLEYYNRESKGSAVKIDNFTGQAPLKLSYKENIIRIQFSALNFIRTNKNQYQYQLEGFSNQWFNLGNTHEVIFTNLDPKRYTLNVKAANNDGKWNEHPTSLDIIVKPPLSQTTIAYILYVLLFILVSQIIYRSFLTRRLRLAENQKLQEMDRLKTKFFTNIAHDFKSPLTVILSSIKKLAPDSRTRILVERSSNSLLDLINQMLELRKLESNKLKLNLVQGNVVECIRHTFESFQEISQEQDIVLHFITSEKQLLMDFDEEKLSRIVANLLSNAIKYNQAKGNVYLLLDQIKQGTVPYLSIRVKDTGIGIAAEDIDQIFNRFYQINPTKIEGIKSGSGVGLALTSELVHLLGGTIKVKSELHKGSEFAVLLPINNQAKNIVIPSSGINAIDLPPTPELESDGFKIMPAQVMEQKRLLLIEDHPDIAEVLIQLLKPYYTIELAVDGEDGIKRAQAQIPDLIISDVMMPKKDGYEVLKVLKADEKTLHIPIILLTAKSSVNNRITGLQKGADAYISKPFSNTELVAQVENLLANRTKLQAYYQQNFNQEKPLNKELKEDPFVKRAKAILLENISDEDFRIPELMKTMGVSRTQLHNKLKAITGQSTSHFINAIRLQKGRELLLESNLTVSEIAYAVGFRDPNYFSGKYKEFYQQTPTETRK